MHLTTSLSLSLSSLLPILSLLLPSPSSAASDTSKPPPKPCTIHSPSTGSYYDLRPLDLALQSSKNPHDTSRTESWHARGYDYPSNFSLNICGPVIEPLKNIAGLPESEWSQVSAFYGGEDGKQNYSIGAANAELVFRGRLLVLNYTGGSPCPEVDGEGHIINQNLKGKEKDKERRKIIGDDDDDRNDKKKQPTATSKRRKSTLLSLHCDRDPSLSTHPSLSFLGTLDHCTYAFEARSRYFCGGAVSSSEPGSLGPGSVFGVIIVIAVLAYLVGGCAYQRVVMRQRGWRQCPNFGGWQRIVGGVTDITTTIFSPCLSPRRFSRSSSNSNSRSGGGGFLPSFNRAFNTSRGGYVHVGENSADDDVGPNSNSAGVRGGTGGGGGGGGGTGGAGTAGKLNVNTIGRGRGSTLEEDENRLIDQLDEEWED